jgi:hypothetical protein
MQSQKKEYCERLYDSKDIISSLYDYNFNMLNSTQKNSLLFTNGDNDNYPAWVLQEAKDVRQDVTTLNAHTIFVLRDYLEMKLDERGLEIDLNSFNKADVSLFLKQLVSSIKKKHPEIPIHIAPTLYEEYIKEVKDNLFITGLNYTYSEVPIDTDAIIKKNLEQNLRLDYLDHNWYSEDHISQPLMNQYNLNYIPAFMELARIYQLKDRLELAKYWHNKAIDLANKSNDEDLVRKIKAWDW